MPLKTPVAGSNVRPAGSVPISDRVGASEPVAVILKLPAAPAVKVAVLAVVKVGGGTATTSVND
ncbi:MAG: hypothetical protein ABI790_12365, partial [Betaproteobacteria bacterium]